MGDRRAKQTSVKQSVEVLTFEFTTLSAPAKPIEIQLQVLFVQAVAGAADEGFGVGNEGVNPVKVVGIGDGIGISREIFDRRSVLDAVNGDAEKTFAEKYQQRHFFLLCHSCFPLCFVIPF